VALDTADLYRRYGDMVLSRCRVLLQNDADAQDAAQAVFLQVHRARDQFRGEAAPSTWLWKATTHTCLNWLRTRRRRREDIVEELPWVATDAMLDPVEVRDLLDAVLEGEDERTQMAVIYHFVDGMTHDEVGEQLGLGGAAIRKRIAGFRERARARLPADLLEAM
jgi:RNA polymerase sigma-70 factor (ECF subfamily)